jgi:hypothetical protein
MLTRASNFFFNCIETSFEIVQCRCKIILVKICYNVGYNCITSIFFGKEAKEKKKRTKKKNYSRRKKVHVASFLRKSRMPSGGEA